MPIASTHHVLIMPSHFWFNALWLPALYYTNRYLFHYFLWEYHLIYDFFDLCPLSQEHNWGMKQGLGVHLLFETFLAVTMQTIWQTCIVIISITVCFHHFPRFLF
jgi:hypothetical protein